MMLDYAAEHRTTCAKSRYSYRGVVLALCVAASVDMVCLTVGSSIYRALITLSIYLVDVIDRFLIQSLKGNQLLQLRSVTYTDEEGKKTPNPLHKKPKWKIRFPGEQTNLLLCSSFEIVAMMAEVEH